MTPPPMLESELVLLEDARKWLRGQFETGAACPCCRQFVKLYKRKLNSAMACALIKVFHYFESPEASVEPWLQVPDYLKSSKLCGDFAKLRHFGLVEPKPKAVRDDGSKRAGFYRMTETGRLFVLGEVSVPMHIYEYNSRIVSVPSPDPTTTTIEKALGARFDYAELMRATPEKLAGV